MWEETEQQYSDQHISNHKTKFITLINLPQGTLENISEVNILATLKLEDNVEKLVIVKLSVKHKVI